MPESKKRMPPLVIDEVILLVDTYFKINRTEEKSEKERLIKDLSDTLKRLPFYNEYKENAEFRSISGMIMCLSNVRSIDDNEGSNFGHGSITQKLVFERYKNDQKLLSDLSSAIKDVSWVNFPIDYSFSKSEIGMLLPSYHLFTERSSKCLKALKSRLEEVNCSKCDICGRDLNDTYSLNNLIEVHLNIPLTDYKAEMTISPSDTTVICPTCHKIAHSKLELFDSNKIKEYIRG